MVRVIWFINDIEIKMIITAFNEFTGFPEDEICDLVDRLNPNESIWSW